MKKTSLLISWMIFHSAFLLGQKVGIGTTTPVATLNLVGPGSLPTIPGITSSGIFRIGATYNEGIDIGKMVDSTFAGWIQAGYDGYVTDPLSLQPMGGNVGIGNVNPGNKLSVTGSANITGNVGIGTVTPLAKLHVVGSLRLVDGTQGSGKVLTSNASGLASWQAPPQPPSTPAYYSTVSICCQSWMNKNLDVSTYRNGDVVPKVTSNTAWSALTTGAYCYYNNDSTTYAATYGKLYNWYAVNDPRGLAPEGWHIPTYFEWTTVSDCLGGTSVAGGPMKEIGTSHWVTPNTGANDLSGFTGLPGGARLMSGSFLNINSLGGWWSSTEDTSGSVWLRSVYAYDAQLSSSSINKKSGFSVRCIRD